MQPTQPFEISLNNDAKSYPVFANWMAHSEPWLTLGFNQQQCLLAFDGPCKEIYSIQYEAKTAGFVILQTAGSFKGYIQTLFVHPDYQGKGLGTQLLQFCEKRISAISPNVFICVSEFNKGAIRLYEAAGFKKIGVLENFVKEGYNEWLYRKTTGALGTFIPKQESAL